MKKFLTFVFTVLFCAFLANLSGQSSQAQNLDGKDSLKELKKQEKFAELVEKANRQGAARVIVGLKGDFQSEGLLSDASTGAQRRKIKDE